MNKEYYVDPIELHNELKNYKQTNQMSDNLGKIFMKMCDRIQNHSNFKNYSKEIKEDMSGHAYMLICRYVHNCDPDIRTAKQCFNYISTIIFNAFKQVLIQHYKQENIKRELIEQKQKEFSQQYGVIVKEDQFELYE